VVPPFVPEVPLLPAPLLVPGIPPVDDAPPVEDTPLVPLALEPVPVPMLFPVEEVTSVVLRQPPRRRAISPAQVSLIADPRSGRCVAIQNGASLANMSGAGFAYFFDFQSYDCSSSELKK